MLNGFAYLALWNTMSNLSDLGPSNFILDKLEIFNLLVLWQV